MMKLLIDAHVFDGKFQGTRTYLEGLYSHMVNHEDIEFYFAACDITKIEKIFGFAQNIHYVKLPRCGSVRRLLTVYPRIIEKYEIDFAHFQYVSPFCKKCKEIVTIHDLLFLDYPQYFPFWYRLSKKYLFMASAKRADLLLTVSEYSRDAITRHFKINKEIIHITYNSVLPVNGETNNIGVKEKYGLDKYILTVSRIEPRKNHLMLLKAFVELGLYNKGYTLVMVGAKDLKYKEFFEYLYSLDDNVRKKILLIEVSFEDLVALYKSATLFVFPSFAEGFGIPPIEAIAYGCPLLCSNVTAMAEFGLPEELYFSPFDLGELKVKMLKQLESPTSADLYAEKVLFKYNWQLIADDYYRLLMA